LFYYILPYGYYIRSFVYTIFVQAEWQACTDQSTAGAICVDSTNGKDVLDALSRVLPLLSSENQVTKDMGIILAISLVFKLASIGAILIRSKRVANLQNGNNNFLIDHPNTTEHIVMEEDDIEA
jgi:GTPase SAR1 family protein